MKKVLFITLALLLQCCALQETVQRESNTAPAHWEYPDSIQVVGTFVEVESKELHHLLEVGYLDSASLESDFIEFGLIESMQSKGTYDIKLEKIQSDSSWFVRCTTRRESIDSYDSTGKFSIKWKQVKVDTIADTTAFTKMIDAMENFVPDTVMVKNWMYVDGDLPFLFYNKENHLMDGRVIGGTFIWQSPKLNTLYDSLVQEYSPK